MSTFTERLKAGTHTDHDSVDHLVMSVSPFINEANYKRFLQVQAVFHRIVDKIYLDESLNSKIPGLAQLARYEMVKSDLKDLDEQELPINEPLPEPKGDEAIGWLYCAEGSNLGAAILFKEVKKIHFDEHHGASHLKGHPDGRAKHWREFVSYLNNLGLTPEQEAHAIQGARDAFAYYKTVVRKVFA